MASRTQPPPPALRIRPLAARLAAAFGLACGLAAVVEPRAFAGSPSIVQGPPHARPNAAAGRAAASPPWPDDGLWHPIPHPLPAVPAGGIAVTNCDDSGPGSLRQASLDAVSGDTIDLTDTPCSRITLTTGSILFTQSNITLQGPGPTYLTISGNGQYAPLLHDAQGTLSVNDLTIASGRKYFTPAQTGAARGGCIFSYGVVSLSGSEVKYCTLQDTRNDFTLPRPEGGAIYAASGVILSNSYLHDNTANGTRGGNGGAIYTPGYVYMSESNVSGNTVGWGSALGGYAGGIGAGNGISVKYSTIANNIATIAGGINAKGNFTVGYSTISGNIAYDTPAGFMSDGSTATASALMLNTTISGNDEIAGTFPGWSYVTIVNSTIAFNYSEGNTSGLNFDHQTATLHLESSIISGNIRSDGQEADLFCPNVFGSNNLIGAAFYAVPPDTISADPQLEHLASNGGRTQTLALRDTSPAIDAGNNSMGLAHDQRGSNYARVFGPRADIGAYEVDFVRRGLIFASGFD
jgi:hypothetical protein